MKKNIKELEIAIQAVSLAGERIISFFGSKDGVIRKSLKELVTKYDIESQSLIIKILSEKFPSYNVLCEEKFSKESFDKPTWVVDPIDGTHNFVSGIPFFGVSIGLIKDSRFTLGVIYFPFEKKLFYAIKGGGAFCNGKKIRVSPTKELSKSMIAYDNQFHLSKDSFKNYEKLVNKAFTTRILGSATRDICFVAKGVLGARIFNCTKLCDIAAGIVILEEADGKVTDFNGEEVGVNTTSIVASNGLIHEELLKLFKDKEVD